MLLLGLLLFLPVPPAAGGEGRPLHSVIATNSSSWVCAPGFFRTASAQQGTCRRCSNLTADDCLRDTERLDPCTGLHNARCVPCEARFLGENQLFVDHCTAIVCRGGFFWNESRCQGCRAGAFCSDGLLSTACGPSLTSPAGASSPLQCMPLPDAPPTQQQLFVLTLLLSVPTDPPLVACPGLFQVVLSWLTYGTLLDCQLGVANYSTGIAGIQCTLLTSREHAALYMRWVGPALQDQREGIQDFLRRCLGREMLMLTEQTVALGAQLQVASAPAPAAAILNHSLSLIYERRRWGTAPSDVVLWLGGFLLLGLALCLSGWMVAAVGCLLCCLKQPMVRRD
jgi:hypothetical protein